MKKSLVMVTAALAVMLVLSVIGTAIVYEKYNINELAETAKESYFSSFPDETKKELTKKLTVDGAETLELKYSNTQTVKDRGYSDVYTDEAGNEYRYDEKGRFYAYTNMDFSDLSFESMEAISDDKAEKLARAYVKNYFGDILNGFELERIYCQNGYATVEFNKMIGPGRMFRGPICYVDVRYDGVLASISCTNVRDLEDFDESLLEGVTEDVLFECAVECAKVDLSGKEHEVISVDNFTVVLVNDAYCVSISAEVLVKASDTDSYNYEYTYYYELEK